MAKHGCYDGTLDASDYSSPMPAIGVYIAMASLVCLISITFDLWYGLSYRKMPWLPSKLFSLNSFTLTIISAATKISVDLNSPMPRAIDQLSKLSSTVLLCVSLGLFIPSVGAMRKSECFENLASLSIVVITVVVNVCIQLFTGVIFAFVEEHLIIIFCMLVLLMLLWSSSSNPTALESTPNFTENFPFIRCTDQMRRTVTRFHHMINVRIPLFVCCQNPNCITASVLCSIPTLVILEATIRSLVVKETRFCNGASDYKWAIWLVVITQLLTIIISSFTIGYRWFSVVSHKSLDWYKSLKNVFEVNKFWYHRIEMWRDPCPFDIPNDSVVNFIKKSKDCISRVLVKLQMGVIRTSQLFEFSCLMLRKSFGFGLRTFRCENDTEMDQRSGLNFEDILYEDQELKKWIVTNIEVDRKKWIESHRWEYPIFLHHLLSKEFPQSVESLLSNIELIGSNYYNRKFKETYEVTRLSLAVLIEIAHSLPNCLTCELMEGLNEALRIIWFVETKSEDIVLHTEIIFEDLDNRENASAHATGEDQEEGDIVHVLDQIKADREIHMKSKYHPDVEFVIISESILSGTYESIPQLSECIERTFREMIIKILADLPRAILMEYCDCPIVEGKERTRKALKFFCILESLGNIIQWSWPSPNNITTLPQHDTPVVNYDSGSTSTTIAINGAEEGSKSAATDVCTTSQHMTEEESTSAAVAFSQNHEITKETESEDIV